MNVYIVPHDRTWNSTFKAESQRILAAIGDTRLVLHHIGSTSVPNIYAKPIIDILGEIDCLANIDQRSDEMRNLGYEVMGEYGIPGRRYFRLDDAQGIRRFHLHVFTSSSHEAMRHLAFRNYLRAHPDVAEEYAELKIRLAKEYPDSMEQYMAGKDAFIKEVQEKAIKWQGTA